MPEFTQLAKVFQLGSQTQIHLCRRVQKPVRVMLESEMLLDSRHCKLKWEQFADLLWSVLPITSLPVQFWEAPGCLFLLPLCCRHHLRRQLWVLSSVQMCGAARPRALPPRLLRGTSSPGQPTSVMCSPGITLLRALLSPRTGCFCGE